jgi:hypothetical protein
MEVFTQISDKKLKERRDHVFFVVKFFVIHADAKQAIFTFTPRKDSPFKQQYRIAFPNQQVVEQACIAAFVAMKEERLLLEPTGKRPESSAIRGSEAKSEKQLKGTIKKNL